ncbi:hypothetical protein JD844_017082, partial [Phrynosoma platyrhinos]
SVLVLVSTALSTNAVLKRQRRVLPARRLPASPKYSTWKSKSAAAEGGGEREAAPELKHGTPPPPPPMPSPEEGDCGGTPRRSPRPPRPPRRPRLGPLVLSACFLAALSLSPSPAGGQLRYSVPEELEHGAFVANLAEDLGLDVGALSARRFRIASRAGGGKPHLEVNLENGILFVNERIDREAVCEAAAGGGGVVGAAPPPCLLHLQLVIEAPLELYRVEVEVLDINDNAPRFPWPEYVLEVAESAAPGSRFPLESAQDPDVGSNSLRTYRLSPSGGFFSLEVQSRSDGSKFAELVLERSLDREQQRSHRLLLTALDGGLPERSGSARVSVAVLDANDNVPVFERPSYAVSLAEDAPPGTLVVRLNATDADEGPNGEVEYSFSGHAPPAARELFSVEPRGGEVRLRAPLDYERASLHELFVQAKDRGPSAVAVHCRLLVRLLDVNDNAPELSLTSVSAPVLEDAPPGTVIAVLSVLDRDSGENGRVSCCELAPTGAPFRLQPSFPDGYTLVTAGALDREAVAEYNLTLTARDGGSPALATRRTLTVAVSDVNDNAPRFLQPSYSVSVAENNAPGASICSVSARDPDGLQNGYLSYSLAEGQEVQGMPAGTYVSVNADSGHMYALRSLDYEQIRRFSVVVLAQDAGFPPLSGNATVTVSVLDQNDNAPVILAPPDLLKNSQGFLNNPLWVKCHEDGYYIQHPPFSNLQVKQPNTDWLPSKQSALKSSQSLEDVGGVRRGVQKDHDRLRTLVTPVSDATFLFTELQKGSGPPNSVWTPRYGPMYSQHISPLDYQHNVYIPGTPTMPASKDGPLFLEQETKNSFSTFGKRKKMTTYCDIHDNMIINNNLK